VSGTTPKPRPARKPVKKQQAPAVHKGLQPLDPSQLLAQATPEQIQTLTHENFALWARMCGIEVDNRNFSFDDRRYLLPIYLDNSKELTWMKAAQTGATVYQLLRLLWYARHHSVKCGLFFPTADGVTKLSKDRLGPMISSNLDLFQNTSEVSNTLGLKQIGNIHGKLSSLYMLYMGGQASKDSVPLDIIAFDEVRLIKEEDIDQAEERTSASDYKIKIFMSTAGYPNRDIHARFLRGTQMYWHVKCGCKYGFVPSDHFPDCIVDTGKEVYMRCPKCKMRINDSMNGNYIAHNPDAEWPSYHISQLVSRKISVKEVWEMYQRTTNMKEFYNAKLGKPYIDVENMPLTDEVLEGAVDYDLRWAYQPGAEKARKKWCAMGVDQHSGNCYAILAKMGSDGRKELVHAEVIDSSNPRYWVDGKPVSPFKRIHELIREFDVRMCVCDAMPNANEAQELARTYPGKVFIAWYSDSGQDMVRWTDRAKTREAIRKGSKQLRLKWQVVLNRYQTIDFLLNQWIGGVFRMPDPRGLSQVAKNETTGRHEMENIITSRLFTHLKSMIRQQTIINEETGKFKMEWVYAGRDPHFTHACNYLNIAMERLKKQARFTLV
jgi:hypothetical protein